MIIIISDASTLILLEKIKLLGLILKENKLIITQGVLREAVTKGKEKKHPDAFELENKINHKLIEVETLKDNKRFKEIQANFNLGIGESESLALFHEIKADILALDDLKAMKYCEYYSLPFTTAVDFVLFYFGKKSISKKTAEEMIEKLGIIGRYKDEIVFYAINYIRGNKNEREP